MRGVSARQESLRSQPSGKQQRTEEEMIVLIVNSVSVEVFPPSTVQKAWLTRTKDGSSIDQELKVTLHW